MGAVDIYDSNQSNPYAELVRQNKALVQRIAELEKTIKTLSSRKANPNVPVSTFAAAPPAVVGDVRFFTDKTFTGASFPGVLATYDGSRWLVLGEDVSTL